ncbi:hypothetical protein BEUL_2227 [Bifidobacterium eulemuris]|uniref:PA14 domain-containing protein n=1 Tax=Bifidobacterium eulemuris TaxID=1765219 RepID=A0A261FYI5_9BIFI|nr:SpaA isopeptide-forming pilin-related protein [Bifidobacterium eulemuris]OZG64025.1 hypothetical protein BEUL_2227 [Bifidobacterium eulemuris]
MTNIAIADPSSQGDADSSQNVQLVQNTDDSDQSTDTTQGTDVSQGTDASQSTDVDTQNTDAQSADDQTDDIVAQNADDGISTAALTGYTVNDTVSPEGSTIDVFDYWLSDSRFAQDNATSTPSDYLNRGINANHSLKFSPNANLLGYKAAEVGNQNPSKTGGNINVWTGKSTDDVGGPYAGIVENTLGEDGYPILKDGNATGITGEESVSESLDYLFNRTSSNSKAVYADADGLLQLDDYGYYYYDSQLNFASLLDGQSSSSSNSFVLYQNPSVNGNNNADKSTGQFFPFNNGTSVFTDSGEAKNIHSDDAVLNHYFGLRMTSTFVQPADGVTDNNQEMQFKFSGDDDVWVFIDGVLVGDVGGIHDRLTLNINFATGEVTVTDGSSYANDSGSPKKYTTNLASNIKQAFENAGKADEVRWGEGARANTFADGTYHELQFYYLERGNGNSNMKLSFNLVEPMSSDVIKVDQSGDSLEGASFALYATDADYTVDEKTLVLATGETDENGYLILTDNTGTIIDFGKRYGDNPDTNAYYVLRETEAPAGYSRMINDMRLRYMPSKNLASGSLVSDPDSDSPNSSIWNTGGVARGKERITALSAFTTYSHSGATNNPCVTECSTKDMLENGTMFAVVLKRDSTDATIEGLSNPANWHVISGDMIEGWSVSKGAATIQNVIAAYQETKASSFRLSSNGYYEANIESLPGYLDEYYFMLDESAKNSTKYTVATYYSTATDANEMNASNTWRVNSDEFGRDFSSRFYIPNIKNELFVQKVDENGDPVAGATFGLYGADQVTVSGDTVTVNENDEGNPAGGTVTTTDSWMNDTDPATPSFKGAAMFAVQSEYQRPDSTEPLRTDISDKPLVNGTYYLVEMEAPAGYQKTTNVSKIVVSDDGIFADAGEADDGIKVVRGVGQLVATMSTFGSTGSFDDTLRYVESVAGSATDVALDANCIASKCSATLTKAGPANLDTARAIDGKLKVSPTTSTTPNSLELTYGGVGAALQYGARFESGDYMFISDTDWPIIRTYQDERPSGATKEESRTDLAKYVANKPNSGQALSSIVTGSVMVQVTNEREGVELTAGSIEVSKTVKGAAATENFSFTLTLQNANTDAIDVISGLDADHGATVTVTKDELGNADAEVNKSFNALKFVTPDDTATPKVYTFIVKENVYLATMPLGWKYDQSEYTVKVQLSYENSAWVAKVASIKQSMDFNGNPIASDQQPDVTQTGAEFVNQYVAVSSLPLTGGPTSMSYVWLGLCIAGAGLLSWLGMNEWRKRHAVQ